MARGGRRPRESEANVSAKTLRSASQPRTRPSVPPVPPGKLLPSCEGPKMHPFKHQHAKILYEEMLSKGNDRSNGRGEGHVFKVRIKSEHYALKLFKFFDLAEERTVFSSAKNKLISDEEFVGHIDPFFAECHAYGRIEEKGYRGRLPENERDYIAAPCYGYIHVSKKDEELLRQEFHIDDWNRPAGAARLRIRGLVKGLIEYDKEIDPQRRSVRRMLSDLLRLRKIGIYQRDVFPRNYRAGLLLDFGQSYTVPHCAMRVLPKWQVDDIKESDLEDFDEMIRNKEIKTIVRASRNYGLTLRSDTIRQKQAETEMS